MSIEQTLIQASRKSSVVIIDGPRCGQKEEIVKRIFNSKPLISLENERYRNLLSQSPKSFFLAFKDGVVIDEAQLEKTAIHSIILEITKTGYFPGKFIIIYNGLASFEDPQRIASKITFIPDSTEKDTPFDTIVRGFCPDTEKLLEEASRRLNISNTDKFREFLILCAQMSGEQFSSGIISEKLGISVPTALKWFGILTDLAVVQQLDSSEINLGIKPYSKPFFVFCSTALLCRLLNINTETDLILSENLEKIVFSYAAIQLIKHRFDQGLPGNLTYFKDRNNKEPVLIADWKYRWIFSVSSGLEANHIQSKNLSRLKAKFSLPDSKAAVLYIGDLTMSFEKTEWVSYLDWKKLAYGLNYYS